MEFDATIELHGTTATGIAVPDEVLDALGAGKRPAVRVTIHGQEFSTTLGSRQGVAMIPVSAERRALVRVVAGDAVRVSIVLDTTPAALTVPDDLAAALAADPSAAEWFAGLTVSQQKGFVVPIEQAKGADTRARRVDKAMDALRARQKRP